MLDLAFLPDRTHPVPVYRQLEDYLRELIGTGRMGPGVKLPATRELARDLGLNRNTVNQAYQDLVAEGLLTAHVGQGTFVAETAPTAPRSLDAGGRSAREFVWTSLYAQRVRNMAVPRGGWVRDARFDFQAGQVAPDALPLREFRKAMTFAMDYHPEVCAQPQDPFGWYPLREAVAAYLVQRGIACGAEDVAIVNGAQQAIDVTARVLVDPGDTVVVEQPGYFGATMAFSGAQANLIGVGVDGEGLRTDELAQVLRARRVKLIYTTPAAQNPTGVVMTTARRAALLALADETQTPVLEDDYDSELRYGEAPIAALKTADPAGQVIYVGTFSKVVFPGLRMGYVVAAQPLLSHIMLARFAADMGTSPLLQVAVHEFLHSGDFERHVRRSRKVYADRLVAMLAALAAYMPAAVTWTEPGGGHTVWVRLPEGTDADALYRAAVAAGVAYTPGEVFFLQPVEPRYLHLSFARHTPEEIHEGVRALAEVMRAGRFVI